MNACYVPSAEFVTLQNICKSNQPKKISVQEVLSLRSSSSALEINVPDFPIDKIKYIRNLGQGAFGQVRHIHVSL